jgi:hypothetical protein
MSNQAYKENFKLIVWEDHDYRAHRKEMPAPARSDLPMPMISGDYKAYECPITGRPVEGRREHRENLAKHGVRVFEKGEFEDVKKNGPKRVQEKIDAAIDRAAEKAAREIL